MPGQTLTEIRRLLQTYDLAPQHRFGQNFLVDLNLMRKLVSFANVQTGDTVLEVGPGTGSLTECLLDAGARVITVEIDHGLQRILRDRLSSNPRFTLVQGDALAGKHRVNPLVLSLLEQQPPTDGGAYRLVANLPYQIATPLLVDLLHVTPRFTSLTATIQREVGERLGANHDTAAYGPVSIITQTLADVTPHAILPPSAFWPRPKVESIMLTIVPRPPADIEVADIPAFIAFVQKGFQQRRKMLRSVFRTDDDVAATLAFGRAGVSPDARPAALSPPQWRAFFAAWSATFTA